MGVAFARRRQNRERRWSPRTELAASMLVECEGRPRTPARVGNLSIGGAFIRAPLPQASDSVTLALSADDAEGNLVVARLHARVVWHSASGTGLMFTDFTPACVRALRALLDTQLPSPGNVATAAHDNSLR